MGNQWNRIKMADCRHPIAHADRLIWQVAFLSDEIGNTVRQELDILRFKAACRYFLKQMVFGFLPKSLQIMLVVVIDGLTRQGIQEIREWLRLKPMREGKPFPQRLLHLIGKLPVGGMNLLAHSLTYIKEIVKRKAGVAVNADGNPFWTGDQVSAYASPLFFGGKDGHILVLCVDQQNIVKALLVEPGRKGQVIPPVPLAADDIGGHDLIDRPQAFIVSQ